MPYSTSKLTILGLALSAAFIFSQIQTARAETTEPGHRALPIRIASWSPKGGPWARWDEGLEGVQAMVNFVNTYGGLSGRPLELLIFKHGDPALIKQHLEACAAENNPITAVVGGRLAVAPATADIYHRSGLDKVPWLGPWQEEDFFYENQANPAFGLLPGFEDQFKLMAAYLAQQTVKGKVVFIHGTDPYGLWAAQKALELAPMFQTAGGLEIWPHQSGHNQITASGPARRKPRAVILWLPPAEADFLLNNSPLRSEPDLIWLTNALTAPQLLNLSEGYRPKVLFPAIVSTKDQITLRYSQSLRKHGPQGLTTGYQALVGFGSAQILVRALNRAGPSPSPDKLVAAFYGLTGYQTILPPLTYTPQNHQAPKGYYLAAMDKNDGHLIRVWP